MVLLEIHQKFKSHFLNELRVSFKIYNVIFASVFALNETSTGFYKFLHHIFFWYCGNVLNKMFCISLIDNIKDSQGCFRR